MIRRENGYTLIELLVVTAILGTILGSITVLFVNGSRAEADLNRRFRAQQDGRVAVDKMRREIHCADQITPAGPINSITVRLPGSCPTAVGGAATNVTYDMAGSGQKWQLRRNSVVLADFVTEQNAFNYTAPVAGVSLGKLRVTLPINTQPTNGLKEWRLVADIVLRNTTR